MGQEIRIAGRPLSDSRRAGTAGLDLWFLARQRGLHSLLDLSEDLSARVSSIVVFIQVPAAEQLEAAEDQVRTIMRNRRGKIFSDDDDEGFSLETQDVFLDLYGKATSNIYIVTIGVAAISLVVGGIVVMNIMLVSVTETNQRDWHSQSDRRAAERHPDAVSDRGGDGNGHRWRDWSGDRIWSGLRDLGTDRISVADQRRFGSAGSWSFVGRGNCQRTLARLARREAWIRLRRCGRNRALSVSVALSCSTCALSDSTCSGLDNVKDYSNCTTASESMRLDDIKESALMAFDTLRANKLRSSLTILGVSVGVVTVIFMVSIIQGLNKAFADQIESLGSNTILAIKV